MKQYIYISDDKLDSLIPQCGRRYQSVIFEQLKARLKLSFKVVEAELEGVGKTSGINRFEHIERLKRHIEENELSGNFGDANPFVMSTVSGVVVVHNTNGKEPDNCLVAPGQVWFAGHESVGTAFLLYGSAKHLSAVRRPITAPDVERPLPGHSSPLDISEYVGEIWQRARESDKMRLEILALRHTVLAPQRVRHLGIEMADREFKLVTGLPSMSPSRSELIAVKTVTSSFGRSDTFFLRRYRPRSTQRAGRALSAGRAGVVGL